jgi:hypothetical protein
MDDTDTEESVAMLQATRLFDDGKNCGINLVLRILPNELESVGLSQKEVHKIISNLKFRLP